MIIKLDNYSLGNKCVSLALDLCTYEDLQRQNVDILFCMNEEICFFPENIKLKISKEVEGKLKGYNNYDVFQLNKEGKLYLYYNNLSTDNAIVTTMKCNSNCIMCPISENARKKECYINADELLRIITHIPSDAEHLTITGGEPFMMGEKIFEVLDKIKEKCPCTEILLLTNGRALSYRPYMEKFVQSISENVLIGIPLHGYDVITHDYITQTYGSFKQTFLGIKNLLSYHFPVEIRIVVSKLNYTYISDIAKLIVNEFVHVQSVKIMGLEMLGNAAKNQKKVWLSYIEAFRASKEAIDILVSEGIDVALYNFPLCAVGKSYHYICAKSITDYKVKFSEVCNDCLIKDTCGGVFAGTMRLAEKDFKAWR